MCLSTYPPSPLNLFTCLTSLISPTTGSAYIFINYTLHCRLQLLPRTSDFATFLPCGVFFAHVLCHALALMNACLGPLYVFHTFHTFSRSQALRHAASLLDAHFGPLHDEALACLVLLATSLRQAHQEALMGGPNNHARGSSSSSCDDCGSVSGALEVLEQLHSRQAAKHGSRSAEAVAALHAVACCQQQLGRSREAEDSWEHAVDLLLAGGSHALRDGDGGGGAAEAGGCEGGFGATDDAAIRGSACFMGLPDAHPQAMAVLQSLAGCRSGAGRLTEAVPLYERLAAGRQAACGREHPDARDAVQLLRAVQAQLPVSAV